ncbi:MAG: hypothetical protein E5V63_29645, partial [Mesorhizobium sp.]
MVSTPLDTVARIADSSLSEFVNVDIERRRMMAAVQNVSPCQFGAYGLIFEGRAFQRLRNSKVSDFPFVECAVMAVKFHDVHCHSSYLRPKRRARRWQWCAWLIAFDAPPTKQTASAAAQSSPMRRALIADI